MADSEEQEWMSLRVAVAWVFTLDRNFLIEFAKDSAPFWEALHKLDVSRGDAVQPNPNAITLGDVWIALRDRIVAGKIELRGKPFKDEMLRAEFKGSPKSRVTVSPKLQSRRIEPRVASKLTIYEESEEFQLTPESVLSPGDWSWRDVELSGREVLLQFPPSVPTSTTLSASERRYAKQLDMLFSRLNKFGARIVPDARGLAPADYVLDEVALAKIRKTRVNILRAYMDLRRSRRATFHSDVQRNEALRAHFNPGLSRKDAKLPSDSTIGRAFSDYKKFTGIVLT